LKLFWKALAGFNRLNLTKYNFWLRFDSFEWSLFLNCQRFHKYISELIWWLALIRVSTVKPLSFFKISSYLILELWVWSETANQKCGNLDTHLILVFNELIRICLFCSLFDSTQDSLLSISKFLFRFCGSLIFQGKRVFLLDVLKLLFGFLHVIIVLRLRRASLFQLRCLSLIHGIWT
jgi:hypothetical protein